MSNVKENPPVLHFSAAILPADDGQPRRFAGIAYSGDVIPNHWAWGDVIFDLASMHLPERIPVLIEHDRNQRAGVIDQFSVSDERGLTVSGYLLDTDAGRAVAAESDAGFPWQMSVHIDPESVEQVQKTTVNGRRLEKSTTVFRGGHIREVSFTPTGADKNTSAQVFNNPLEVHVMSEEATNVAELKALVEKLKAENEALKAQFAEKVLSERVEKFSAVMGEEPTDEERDAIAGMTDAQFALLLKKPALPKADPVLFSEQAVSGRTSDIEDMPLVNYIKSRQI